MNLNAVDKIANKLGCEYEKQVPDLDPFKKAECQVTQIGNDITALSKQIDGLNALPLVTIKDQDYLDVKIKSLISRSESVLKDLEDDLKNPAIIGPNMRMRGYEVHATITNAISIQIRELRELNKMMMGLNLVNLESQTKAEKEREAQSKPESKNITVTPADLLKLVKAAQETSQMNSVEAEFTVVKDPTYKPQRQKEEE